LGNGSGVIILALQRDSTAMSLALLAALPFIGAILVALFARYGKNVISGVAGVSTLTALFGIFGHVPALMRGEAVFTQIAWIPALGLNANFMLDGLGLLFALLILGIGFLIIIYARFYLGKTDPFARFFVFLLLFQGAMLGIVLSDNILMMLVFWELTSLTSFLLIGYWRHDAAARGGARMALAITGAGGLALFAGLLLLGQIAGSYDLSVILTKADVIQSSPLFLPMLALILLGAFTKSAQMPFHFWLPHAMAAPTPVSAYLHSATMVKAGLFLMARLWPVLSGSDAWFYAVSTVGLLTMVYGAKVALFKDDLKAILAYSTISHLGLITFLLGLGTKAAATAAVFHIICHATFKAPLFMAAGIVDHEAHTRNLGALGGLRRAMPITFLIAALAGASMAGVPLLNGFLSKEMALEEAAHTAWLGMDWIIPLLATIGALLSVAYTYRLIGGIFLGAPRTELARVHDPKLGLWGPPAILVALVVAVGIVPMPLAAWLVDLATGAVTGEQVTAKIVHWHGLKSPALWMSIFAFGAAILVISAYPRLRALWQNSPRGDGKRAFDATLGGLVLAARSTVARLHDGALSRYMAIAVVTILGVAGYAYWGANFGPAERMLTPVSLAPALMTLILLIVLAIAVVQHGARLQALLLVGVVGLIISAGFAYLSAPDLALTQVAVEVVTIILLLLALNFLPKETPVERGWLQRWGAVIIGGAAGIGAGALAYALMLRDAAFPVISAFHLEQSKPGAGGTNSVNTIIVDFRGFDTYGEIIVLGIAALIISALVESLLSTTAVTARLKQIFPSTGRAGDRHPMMMVVATRVLLPIGLLIGVYIFLRGHNLPGGGFVAGLVVAIALLLQYIASGYGWSVARKRINYHTMIGAGVLVASATGIGSWLAGRPFLTSNFAYISLPPLETFELATAALFDLGVFLCVLGAVMLALATLARLAQAGGEAAAKTPFDTVINSKERA
jgi:multicomponent K+:H+ antiporter subunit A